LAHRMLMADQQKIKSALTAFVEQTEKAGINLTTQQWTAFQSFWKMYTASLHHHHDNEEKIAFPYLSDVKKVQSKQKATTDHVTLLTALDNMDGMVAAFKTDESISAEQQAESLRILLESFIIFDEALVEHFYEEEERFLPNLRKFCTVKEIQKNVVKPIVATMGWADRGQYFGKLLTPDTRLKAFMKQEGIPFFVKWIFRANINKYNRIYVAPLDAAVVRAKESVIASGSAPAAAAAPAAISAGGH
jgi:hemerythrin-like domain-containing protein